MTDLADIVTSAFWRVNPPDADPPKPASGSTPSTRWSQSEGRERATFLLRKLLDHARARRVPLPPVLNTPYKNSIALADQPQFPGNLELESRISAIVRWNALAMVVRANRAYPELGGHIASYASAADLFEVGFNHFFRGGKEGDLVTSSRIRRPASMRARSSRAGFPEEQPGALPPGNAVGKGSSSYCHPYLMPEFWQFPTGSMGLGPAQRDLPGALHALPRAPRAARSTEGRARSGRSSATARWTSPNRSPACRSPRARGSTT